MERAELNTWPGCQKPREEILPRCLALLQWVEDSTTRQLHARACLLQKALRTFPWFTKPEEMVLPDAAGNFLSAPSWLVARGCFVTPANELLALCLMTALTDSCTEAVKTFSAVSALLLPGAYPESSPALASRPALSAALAARSWAEQDPWAQRSRGGLPATAPRVVASPSHFQGDLKRAEGAGVPRTLQQWKSSSATASRPSLLAEGLC